MREKFRLVEKKLDGFLSIQQGVKKAHYGKWKQATRPFHWFSDYSSILERGGFDVIIGNPPYRRLKVGERDSLVGRWMDELWNDLKLPVITAGKGGDLVSFHESSIAFWRWAIWKIFEAENAPERGVVTFISNRKYLTGWTFAGLRKMMRLRFDRIEIVDLRGDVNSGPRGDVEADQGVFDIKVGTAILLVCTTLAKI